MKRVAIMGGPGVGMIAAYIIDTLPDMEVLGFINDNITGGESVGAFRRFPVIGKSEDVHRIISPPDCFVVLAYKTMKKERAMWDNLIALDIPREKFINVLHPSARIPRGFCSLGTGIIAAPGAQLSSDVSIADNCFLLGNCFVGHDAVLERYVSVTNNASIGAEVHVGRGAHIGSNATIREKVKIGEFSLVGMGSVVLEDVSPGVIVAGTPARPIGTTE